MVCHEEALVKQVTQLYEKISNLESFKPSENVNMLFTKLVLICTPPSPVDVTKLSDEVQKMRSKLIRMCGEAEGIMEKHYSTLLGSYAKPLDHLDIFPYFSNYIKLSLLEYNILTQHSNQVPKRVAFMGSGPLPLTSIVLALYHLPNTRFDNYDIDLSANEMAARLVASEINLSDRMHFYTKDVMSIGKDELEEYDVVFLAALVGMDKESKIQIVQHLAKNMKPSSTLMVRSAHGTRAFLYPIVDPNDLSGFEVLSVFHPTDEVINSVVIARKTFDKTSSVHSMEHNHNFSPIGILKSGKDTEIHALT